METEDEYLLKREHVYLPLCAFTGICFAYVADGRLLTLYKRNFQNELMRWFVVYTEIPVMMKKIKQLPGLLKAVQYT